MSRHHYNPLSVLRTFASREAWKVVKAPGEIKRRIALADANTIDNGQIRNWPVVIYEKSKTRITRRPIGQVCSTPQLYRVPDYGDQLIRAIVRLNLREDPYTLIQGFNFEALLRLGVEPLDPEWIERTAIGNLDRDFAKLLPLLRGGLSLTTEQMATLRRFVVFARFRTPMWRRRYFHELYGHRVTSLREEIRLISKIVENDLPKEFRGSLDHFNEIADEHVYHMAMMSHAREGFDALNAMVEPKIKILYTTNSIPFVTCDNPARPYKPNRLNEIFDSFLPGFKDPSVQILYPVSPLCCIVISSNRSWGKFSHQVASPSSVRAMNTALAIMADEEIVFASPDTSVFQRWLRLDAMRSLLRP